MTAIRLCVQQVSEVIASYFMSLLISYHRSPSIHASHLLTENQVYSWGRGDNGSLGIPMANIKKTTKDGIPVTSLPKPIFGSLHAVTDLACRHWHTIIVAGEVILSFLWLVVQRALGEWEAWVINAISALLAATEKS